MFFNKITPTDHPNKKWEVLHANATLTIRAQRLFRRDMGFMTIGSCFAEEIRKALTARAVRCYPEYRHIQIDPDRMKVDTLPAREHMNYYNTYSIRQELERAAGLWTQDPADFWRVPKRDIREGQFVAGDHTLCQDPYRRLVFGRTPEDLHQALSQINTVMREGFERADVCVITLGMTEVFKKKDNGLVCNQVPVYGGGSGLRETFFHASDYEENLENMRVSLRLLKAMNPKVQVVLTVSPVPLHRSFGPEDIFVNNYESKCTLRAVAGKICREHDWVHYFPSFEIVWGMGFAAYQTKDRLHVKEEVVDRIIGAFVEAHFQPEAEAHDGPA
ncbi:MAG TPA: GSCFA domain-containing protein [Thiobacillaceae bacterium]|nr:GSCFA domain-containing protein [Thiobacillaceae bacterium]HNA81556.1 GSCFA domain-containing protein [Thiobacillaceae bacterium]HNF88094.1 GSCFA domain-containing protein [Thiobacillaceae bacterium]HNH90238.1 GSCFA domain-containing protein [Thiobacillaceae bacterium]HNI07292.1 GSCFA domain-containing protein [Thiobacillaceae bacterium]